MDAVRWGNFFIEDVADILSGHDIYEYDRTSGDTPYISSSAVNNGICDFVGNTNDTLEAGCISVNRTGSVGYAFYHPYPTLYSNNCRKLRPHVQNKYVGLFLAQQITGQHEKYNYGYIMGTERLKRQKILLPVDDTTGQPDYIYMENFVKLKIKGILENYKKYLSRI